VVSEKGAVAFDALCDPGQTQRFPDGGLGA